jgi:hypothetical protein
MAVSVVSLCLRVQSTLSWQNNGVQFMQGTVGCVHVARGAARALRRGQDSTRRDRADPGATWAINPRLLETVLVRVSGSGRAAAINRVAVGNSEHYSLACSLARLLCDVVWLTQRPLCAWSGCYRVVLDISDRGAISGHTRADRASQPKTLEAKFPTNHRGEPQCKCYL